ncbi:serine/threonine protein kinase [Nucisporomicrobium flavum]|uniref:serine/threonine protein kinase n=1 Tax=Nucisporomicrobium flavum TaxID=2785915 RepID=UPI0018F4D04F|nr:serine/threonine-protein kinase [Nucisporomicrobium flavum]
MTIIDGYLLLSRIGRGGTATVFLATPLAGGPPVAVKLIRHGTGASSRREFAIASAVDAGCTAAPIAHGVTATGSYLITAYLQGYRSGAGLMGDTMPVASLLTFGGELAGRLASLHDSGVVHCDVKPSNLLVGDDDVRVIDFGISRYVGELPPEDGFVQCSRGWAAPEQLRGEPLAPSTDVFAWGSLMAYLSTGFHPFAGRGEADWIRRVGSGRPNLSGLHHGLDAVVRAALAHDPRDRPGARELAAICRDGTRRASTPEPAARPRPATVRTEAAQEDTAACAV